MTAPTPPEGTPTGDRESLRDTSAAGEGLDAIRWTRDTIGTAPISTQIDERYSASHLEVNYGI